MAQVRQAEANWSGDLLAGGGSVTATSSGIFSDQAITWRARTEASEGKTSPEELIAAAHATCFSMELAHTLAEAGTPPDELSTDATCTFAQVEGGFRIASMVLSVKGRVPALDAAGFSAAAAQAKDGCPVSGALKGNVTVSVSAELV